jgi:OmpA-OmpF porin, OOP family
MKIALLSFLIVLFTGSLMYGQIDLLKKVKEKVEQKIEQKTDEKIDEGIEKVADDIESSKSSDAEETTPAEPEPVKEKSPDQSKSEAAPAADKKLQVYSNYDFIPGEQIFFYDDFSYDKIGDFPAKWNTNSMGDVVTLNNFPGNWFRMNLGGTFYPEIDKAFPENFTVEFDLIFSFNEINDITGAYLDFYSTIEGERMDGIVPGNGGFRLALEGYSVKSFNWLNSNYGDIDISFDNNYFQKKNEQIVKVSISVHGQRVKMFLDENKIFDIPRLVSKNLSIDRFRFFQWGTESELFNFYISNLRIAVGSPDTRSKLITEGKLVTRGIYFDSGSDVVKPESYGTLKDIASVLNDNPAVKVKIVGHTDSDGSDQLNLDLSKRRALSVKNVLSSEFSVTAERLEYDGKGESEPVSDNNSTEGKANNRRVEFIKL